MTATDATAVRDVLHALCDERGTETIPLEMAVNETVSRLSMDEKDATRHVREQAAEVTQSPWGDDLVRRPEATPEPTEEAEEAEEDEAPEATIPASPEDIDIGSLKQEAGEPTGGRQHNLTVFSDVDHPLVPRDVAYYASEVGSSGRTDLDVTGHMLSSPNYAVLLVGHAGTGKNAIINKLGSLTRTPVVRIPFSVDVAYEDVVGTFVPQEDGSGFEWRDGALTAAVRHGWWVVCDEINAAPPEVMTALHQVTEEGEERALLIRETQEVVKPHPNFRFVGTMNPNYSGTAPLNKAFASRFKHREVDYLPKEAEVNVLTDKTGLEETEARKLVELANKLRDRLKADDIRTPVTPRHLLQIGEEAEVMGLKEATEMLLLPYAEEMDRDVMESVINKVF